MEFKTALKHSWCLAPLFFEAEPPLQHSGENPRNEVLLSDKLVGAPLFIFKKLRDCPDEKSKCPDPLFDVRCSMFRIPPHTHQRQSLSHHPHAQPPFEIPPFSYKKAQSLHHPPNRNPFDVES